MDTRANILEKKTIIFEEHAQTMFREKGNKRKSCMTLDEPIKTFPNSSLYTPIPLTCSPPSQIPTWENGQGINSSNFQSNKQKRTKVYHSLPVTYAELLPILIQNYRIFVLLTKPRRPPYPREYDVNARCEYHGGVEGHSTENYMAFKNKVHAVIDSNPNKFKEQVNGHQG